MVWSFSFSLFFLVGLLGKEDENVNVASALLVPALKLGLGGWDHDVRTSYTYECVQVALMVFKVTHISPACTKKRVREKGKEQEKNVV